MGEKMWYACENDFCPRYATPVEIRPGDDVECPECGWFMTAMYDRPGDLAT